MIRYRISTKALLATQFGFWCLIINHNPTRALDIKELDSILPSFNLRVRMKGVVAFLFQRHGATSAEAGSGSASAWSEAARSIEATSGQSPSTPQSASAGPGTTSSKTSRQRSHSCAWPHLLFGPFFCHSFDLSCCLIRDFTGTTAYCCHVFQEVWSFFADLCALVLRCFQGIIC